jgi:hypothetical protein
MRDEVRRDIGWVWALISRGTVKLCMVFVVLLFSFGASGMCKDGGSFHGCKGAARWCEDCRDITFWVGRKALIYARDVSYLRTDSDVTTDLL